MSVEDLGFTAMARSAPDDPVVRGAALAVASTLLGFGSLRTFGVSPMAAVAGGAMLGAVGAKVGSQRSSRDSTSGVEWSNIKVSKNHERLIATTALANTVQTPSLILAIGSAAAYGIGYYLERENVMSFSATAGALGLGGLVVSTVIHYQAGKNEAEESARLANLGFSIKK